MADPDSGGAGTDGGSPPLVRIEGAHVHLGSRHVLDSVDLVLRAGEITSLVGPNGAGKSTLIRLVLGILSPSRGRVIRQKGLRIGYVPQKLQVDQALPMSVARFLSLAHRIDGERLRHALFEVGVEELADRAMQELSGGELQRVLLARALLRRPDLLVLDEPGQGVDLGGQGELFRLIDRVRREHGCAVLLVSHDLHLVMAATDHVVCLNRHVCCTGRPEAVSDHPEYRALFGRRTAATLAVYQHHHDHAHDLHGQVVEAGALHGQVVETEALHGQVVEAGALHGQVVETEVLHGQVVDSGSLRRHVNGEDGCQGGCKEKKA
ncbi:MAG: zinc ABC transporter ATP-binding protein ZnuC [Geminicoccaceae bacterium]